MGTCLSRPGQGVVDAVAGPQPSKRQLSIRTKNTGGKDNSGISPSNNTERTQPPTPLDGSFSPFFPRRRDDANDDDDQDWLDESGAFSSLSQINRGQAVIESVISEEESLGAPSDEEELHALHIKKTRKKQVNHVPTAITSSPAVEGLQSRTKLLRKRITAPGSIIHRPSLVAPPQGLEVQQLSGSTKSSVNPQTIASFNKLKIQVQLANRAEKHRRHKAKVEDRYEDVRGYRNLWSNYEEIQQQVEAYNSGTEKEAATPGHKKSDSMDLKEPTSWYFDSQTLHGQHYDEDDDARSQSSLSLLSEASMEAQKKFFDEKVKERKKRRSRRKGGRKRRDSSDERSITSANSTSSKKSGSFFIRGTMDDNDYGPIRHTYDLGSDDSTPRAKSKAKEDTGEKAPAHSNDNDDASIISDLGMENDYNVPRRRRKVLDDSTISTLGDHSQEPNRHSLSEVDPADFELRIQSVEKAIKSIEFRRKKSAESSTSRIEAYGFDPSAPLSTQIETFALPSLEIEDPGTGTVKWRDFREKVGSEREERLTARRLVDLYGEDDAKDGAEVVKVPASGNNEEKVDENDIVSELLSRQPLGKQSTTELEGIVGQEINTSTESTAAESAATQKANGGSPPKGVNPETPPTGAKIKTGSCARPVLERDSDYLLKTTIMDMPTEQFRSMVFRGVDYTDMSDGSGSPESKQSVADEKEAGLSENVDPNQESPRAQSPISVPAHSPVSVNEPTTKEVSIPVTGPDSSISDPQPKRDPVIESMSTEAFLHFSSWHSPSFHVLDDSNVSQEQSSSSLKELAVDGAAVSFSDDESTGIRKVELVDCERSGDGSPSRNFGDPEVATSSEETGTNETSRSCDTDTVSSQADDECAIDVTEVVDSQTPTPVEAEAAPQNDDGALADAVSNQVDELLSRFREEESLVEVEN